MHNQECRIRSKIKDINGNKPLFYPYNIQVGISYPYAKLCAPHVVKNIMSKYLIWCQELMK